MVSTKIFGSVAIGSIGLIAETDAAQLSWPPSVDAAAFLHLHNVFRCMHDVPQLQWSTAIAEESQNWANKIGSEMTHGHLDEHAGGFDYLGQNLWIWSGGGSLDVDPISGIQSWYDEVKYTDNGKTSDMCSDSKCGHYTQMVWQSSTHVGCGLWTGTKDDARVVQLVCDYGEGGNYVGAFSEQVLARNGISQADCESIVKSRIDPTVPRPVRIGFVPQSLAASQNAGGCQIGEYRLLFKGGQLALAALDGDGNPCDSSLSKGEIDVPWEYSTQGIFSGNSGTKVCLQMDRSKQLVTNSQSSVLCTSNNNVDGLGWKFTQMGVGVNMCMQDVPDTHSGKYFVTDLNSAGSPGSCSSNWHMDVFGQEEHSTMNRQSCSECQSQMGNFVCATDAGCVLAPTSKDCTALRGEWCSSPTPPPPPPPSPSPAACEAHPACKDLQGDCCPTTADVMLNCCSQSDFMLV